MIVRKILIERLLEFNGINAVVQNIGNQIKKDFIESLVKILKKYQEKIDTPYKFSLESGAIIIINYIQSKKFQYNGETNNFIETIRNFNKKGEYPNLGIVNFKEIAGSHGHIFLDQETSKKFGKIELDNEELFDLIKDSLDYYSQYTSELDEVSSDPVFNNSFNKIISTLTHEFKHLLDYIKSKGNIFQTKKSKRYELLRNLPDSLQTDEISKEIDYLYQIIPSETLARFAEFIGNLDWSSYENNFKGLFGFFKRNYSDLEFMSSKERKRIIGMLYSLWVESQDSKK